MTIEEEPCSRSSTQPAAAQAPPSSLPKLPPGPVTPLPRLQITLTLLIQASEPITAEVIYPFIPEFIRRTGVTGGNESKTGYYAGIIASNQLHAPEWNNELTFLHRNPYSFSPKV